MLSSLFSSLSLTTSQQDLYTLAFTHKSYTNEQGAGESNERLEFLGDAVLELLISEYLYKTYPKSDEGEMTGLRSATVRKESLALAARNLHFGDYLLLSNGEKKSQGNQKDYLLANTFEAFLGALFLDQGIEKCKLFLEKHLFGMIEHFREHSAYIGPKTKFQEAAQAKFSITPHYELISEEGPDHSKTFIMAAMLGDKKVAEGHGNSKQKAESVAADAAFKALFSAKNTEL